MEQPRGPARRPSEIAVSIKLRAESDASTETRQHIGLVVGPDRRFGVKLEFVGRKLKRSSEVTVVSPGLYKTRNTDRRAETDTYYVIWALADDLIKTEVSEATALELAGAMVHDGKEIPRPDLERLLNDTGRRVEIAGLEYKLSQSDGKPMSGVVNLSPDAAEKLGILPGKTLRGDVVAARRAYLDRLRGVVTPGRPIEIDALPSDPRHRRAALETERAKLVERLAQIDAELAALDVEKPLGVAPPAGEHHAPAV